MKLVKVENTSYNVEHILSIETHTENGWVKLTLINGVIIVIDYDELPKLLEFFGGVIDLKKWNQT